MMAECSAGRHLETGLLGQPSALALNAANNLLAVGNQDGWIYLLDENSGKLITSWQASTEKLDRFDFYPLGRITGQSGWQRGTRFLGSKIRPFRMYDYLYLAESKVSQT